QRLTLEIARIIKESFLRQSAFHPIDVYCPLDKTYQMLNLIFKLRDKMRDAINKGIPLAELLSLPVVEIISRMKIVDYEEFRKTIPTINRSIDEQIDKLIEKSAKGGGF
ncbi:MAG: V-type ATP synthase subunit A, partial [Candidatus Bathyarchaeia archaeon]